MAGWRQLVRWLPSGFGQRSRAGGASAAPATWVHPRLGTFAYGLHVWHRRVAAPGFDAFSFDTGHGNARQSDGKYPLAFEAADASDVPSPEMAALADAVLADPRPLVAAVTRALWEEFNG